eukprot:scaffold26196_cov37-Phaeocystis_antarctica.AAC.1
MQLFHEAGGEETHATRQARTLPLTLPLTHTHTAHPQPHPYPHPNPNPNPRRGAPSRRCVRTAAWP